MSLSDTTVMPDGRPLFAWRNELEMLRAQEVKATMQERDIIALMNILQVVRVSQRENSEMQRLEIVVTFNDMVTNRDFLQNPTKYFNVTSFKKDGTKICHQNL